MAVPTQRTRGSKAVVEPVRTGREAKGSQAGATSLVQDVDAVTPAMPTGDIGRLSVQTHTKAAEAAKLTHGSLMPTKRTHTHAHRHGAVDATVSTTSCGHSGGLERGEDLVGCELMVVKSLLLLLQRLDLVLDCNLANASQY